MHLKVAGRRAVPVRAGEGRRDSFRGAKCQRLAPQGNGFSLGCMTCREAGKIRDMYGSTRLLDWCARDMFSVLS